MTLFLPLEDSVAVSSTPSFVTKPSDAKAQVAKVLKAILKAKRIVVICGGCAGISVHAGIPDFRSSEGLFQTLKRDNPKDALSSGRDLFDASVFNTEHKTALFCQMISRLSDLSKAAEPTPFHYLLRSLDTNGRLLRTYTQNIDAIESKSGLSFGVPEFQGKKSKPRNINTATTFHQEEDDPGPSTAVNRTPRCIPLHGTLQLVHCQTCTQSFPLSDYLPSLASGIPPDCPECTSMERTRQLVGKRPRGVGKLRPSVVLYNETHKDGEGVGEIVQKDLIGSKGRSGADLLLVVGTSLRVPGTKRMVREFSKAVHSRRSSSKESTPGGDDQGSQQQQQQQQPQPLKSIYLNLDFPVPTRDWEGVFDAWVQGDVQTFAQMMQEELDREIRAKQAAIEKKKKKEEEIALAALFGEPLVKPKSKPKMKARLAKKRKVLSGGEGPRMSRKKLVVEIPVPPRNLTRTPHHDIYGLSRSPVSSLPLTLRIPARPLGPALGTQDFRAQLLPLTPVKKSSSSPFALGRPPPTPEHTPGRAISVPSSPKYRSHSSISFTGPTNNNRSHSSSLSLPPSPSRANYGPPPASVNIISLLSGDEDEDAEEAENETASDSDIDIDIDVDTDPWRDSRIGWHGSGGAQDRGWSGDGSVHGGHGRMGGGGMSGYPLPGSRNSPSICLPMSDAKGDISMVDIGGHTSENFRDQLGMSCLRTTQEVEVREGG